MLEQSLIQLLYFQSTRDPRSLLCISVHSFVYHFEQEQPQLLWANSLNDGRLPCLERYQVYIFQKMSRLSLIKSHRSPGQWRHRCRWMSSQCQELNSNRFLILILGFSFGTIGSYGKSSRFRQHRSKVKIVWQGIWGCKCGLWVEKEQVSKISLDVFKEIRALSWNWFGISWSC